MPVEYVEPASFALGVGSSRDTPIVPEPEPVPTAEGEESDDSMGDSSHQDAPQVTYVGEWEPEDLQPGHDETCWQEKNC